MQEKTAVVALSALNSWHAKYQATFPLLTHVRIVAIQRVVESLINISLKFENQELLTAGENIPHDKCARILRLMHGTLERLQLGTNANSIALCG